MIQTREVVLSPTGGGAADAHRWATRPMIQVRSKSCLVASALVVIGVAGCTAIPTPFPTPTPSPSRTTFITATITPTTIHVTVTRTQVSPTATQIPTGTPTIDFSGKLAFLSQRNEGVPELYVMNADGSEQTRLTFDLINGQMPSWSPDGAKIALTANLLTENGPPIKLSKQIRVVNSDGSGMILPVAEDAEFPSWSADSQSIVFAAKGDIYRVNLDGTQPVRLTHDPAIDTLPIWSPDGSKIAFASERAGTYDIYTMAEDGSEQTRLTHIESSDFISAQWSPDSTRLAIVAGSYQNVDIYLINVDGSGFMNLTNSPHYESEPAWSPDSTTLAFVSDQDGDLEIYTIKADGSGLTKLTGNAAWDSAPAWSPDGTRIAYTSDRAGNFEIYIMNVDGSRPTRLTFDEQLDVAPEWQPSN